MQRKNSAIIGTIGQSERENARARARESVCVRENGRVERERESERKTYIHI
jgi:hypothetical protein